MRGTKSPFALARVESRFRLKGMVSSACWAAKGRVLESARGTRGPLELAGGGGGELELATGTGRGASARGVTERLSFGGESFADEI